ncbi:dihydrodipicolinate reductase [Mycolicibacterium pulveris]|uniref:Dihydrodipicolinate reductase n=1 Tax=Mycolicibacterium pulveris TaxID=36813 RepID=A0A7I7UJD5_MYCPV|nr:dihydrodipicolinate reductase [Mycolicibacterium pulveris]
MAAIAKNPNYELVGLYAWSDDKVGKDAGEVAGIAPLGVKATNDADALLALKPDVVVYNPMWINVDELVRILSSGINVVSSASFITGHNLGADRDRLEEACKKGGATLFGSGVSPGFAELLAIVAATACDRVDKITIAESADTTLYDSPDTERPVGFGTAIDDPNLAPMASTGTAVFAEAVQLLADSLGVTLDEIKCVAEYAQTTEDLVMASWTIPAGHVAGVYIRWLGLVGGEPLIEVSVRWKKGQTLDPDWQLDGDGWKITIDGRPTVNMAVGFLPPQDMIEQAKSIEDFFELGHIMTAMPPIHAIPAVVAAAPGIATYNDLPLPQARGIVPTK